jgi:hypothetical protein
MSDRVISAFTTNSKQQESPADLKKQKQEDLELSITEEHPKVKIFLERQASLHNEKLSK